MPLGQIRIYFTRRKTLLIALLFASGAVIYNSVRTNIGLTDAAAASRRRVFICSETGKTFEAIIGAGTAAVVKSPHSGKLTGYLAELCYWTADGQIKQTPTAVLLNERIDKPGPTFCPDCGRLVARDNPSAMAGYAPPTREEYERMEGRDELGR